MKIGKTAAFLIGGGIIFLEVANEQGWIRVDCTFCYRGWIFCNLFSSLLGSQISNGIDKAAEKVEEVTANEGPRFLDRVSECDDASKFECSTNFSAFTGETVMPK